MTPVLSFPFLEGMTYPKLSRRKVIRVIDNAGSIAALSSAERAEVRILMTSASRGCDADLVACLPNLALVVSQGAGRDKLDEAVLATRSITLRCVDEAVVDDVADLAMALTQMLCRQLLPADAFARSGEWERRRFSMGTSLAGLTMGIAGASGRIGRAIATRARASRMAIAALDRPSNHGLDVRMYADWESLAEASDVLVLATPGTASLKHVVNGRVLKSLGSEGRLINVGRGDLVDTEALISALEAGEIAGAGLDVFETEPHVPARLARMGNVVLTPHIGAQTFGQRARSAKIAEDVVLAFLDSHRT